MPTQYEKVCPKCGCKWSSTFSNCQKCPGVALEVRDLAGNLIPGAVNPVNAVNQGTRVYHNDPNCPGPMCPYCSP